MDNKVLVKYVVVSGMQPEEGKQSPVHKTKTIGMEMYSSKEEALYAINKAGYGHFKNKVIKNIYSINEFGVTVKHEIVFNGKLCLVPVKEYKKEFTFEDIDEMLDDENGGYMDDDIWCLEATEAPYKKL